MIGRQDDRAAGNTYLTRRFRGFHHAGRVSRYARVGAAAMPTRELPSQARVPHAPGLLLVRGSEWRERGALDG